MIHLFIALQGQQVRNPHRSKFAHPPKVIALQIRDHEQLRAFFCRFKQLAGRGGIPLRVLMPRACSLDGPRADMPSVQIKE